MEYGTPNVVGIASLYAGQDWIEQQGMENIYAHEISLVKKLVEGFSGIEGITVYCCNSMENHLSTVTMNIDGIDAGNVGTMLDVDYNLATRTGLHCAPLIHEHYGTAPRGTVRFSIGPFNTKEHIETAIKAVREIAADRPV